MEGTQSKLNGQDIHANLYLFCQLNFLLPDEHHSEKLIRFVARVIRLQDERSFILVSCPQCSVCCMNDVMIDTQLAHMRGIINVGDLVEVVGARGTSCDSRPMVISYIVRNVNGLNYEQFKSSITLLYDQINVPNCYLSLDFLHCIHYKNEQ